MESQNDGRLIQKFISTYVAFDLETTGVNYREDEIIEIGAIKVIDETIVDTFSKLIKPSIHIPSSATNVHGITDEMVNEADSIEIGLKEFLDFIECYPLLGHNIAFDLKFINKHLGKKITNDFVDTLSIAKNNIFDVNTYKLQTLCQHFNIDSANAHRALSDCYMSIKLYNTFKKLLKDKSTVSFGSVKMPSPRIYPNCNYTDETKPLQSLQSLLNNIIFDKILTDNEIINLKNWLDENISLKGNYPFDQIFNCLDKTLKHSTLTYLEKNKLLKLFQQFVSPISCSQDVQEISFEKNEFCLTGNFETGPKSSIEKIIRDKNGLVSKTVKKSVSYLLVGDKGSPDWKNKTYGEKIKKALEMQHAGSSIKIIRENQFLKLIS